MARKPILCVDFDGVIHAYTSGWQGSAVITDGPVPGALEFLREATKFFRVAIFSSRSATPQGIDAMRNWLARHAVGSGNLGWLTEIEWPTTKPSALVTLDDRAIQFEGVWPSMTKLYNFKPWWDSPTVG